MSNSIQTPSNLINIDGSSQPQYYGSYQSTNNESNNGNGHNEFINNKLPHQKSMEIIIINLREMIHLILQKLIKKENPIPYINSTPDRFFTCAILLIIIGTTLLLLSNLMKN